MQNKQGTGKVLSFTRENTKEKTPLYLNGKETSFTQPHQLRNQYINAIAYLDEILEEYEAKQIEILHRMEYTTYSASWGYIEFKELQDLRIYRRRLKKERQYYFEMNAKLGTSSVKSVFKFLRDTDTLEQYALYKEDIRNRYPVFPLVEGSKEKWNQEVRDKQI